MRKRTKKPSKPQAIPQHRLDATRQQWTRKPQTQVVINKKAEQRRTMCRNKGIPDGAIYLHSFKFHKTGYQHREGWFPSLKGCRSCRGR